MKLPEYVIIALNLLEKSGYEAVVVGGAVRDFLLNLNPNDYDISTNALPDEIKHVFNNYYTLDTGIKHGTITVFINHHQIEITTYRNEEDYEDYRHPKKVVFVKSLDSDLSRRDFTINAICFNKNIIDHVGGIDDLNNKIIRAIGEANTRFNEDPLRILRAIRFASTLGFTIEEKTKLAMYKNVHLIDKVSKERINVEFNKLIMGKYADVILHEYIEIVQQFIPELNNIDINIKTLEYLDDDLNLKLASLFLNLGSSSTYDILRRLKYSNYTVKIVCFYIENYKLIFEVNESYLIKLLTNYSFQELKMIIVLKKAFNKVLNKEDENLYLDKCFRLLDKISHEKDCFRVKDLKINGTDLLKIGFKEGVTIRFALEKILNEIIEGNLSNKKENLINYAKNYLKEINSKI